MRTRLIFLVLMTACGFAQETKADRARAIADMALAAPPELAADVLIKLTALPDVGPKERKIEWLERAFALAPGAKYPLRLAGALGMSGQTDSSVGSLQTALGAGLDTLSLRSRVIRAMLPLDRERAMSLFRSMPPLELPARSCSDSMVVQPVAYYEMLTAIYQQGFTPEEKKEGRDVELLRSAVARLQSPMELEHVMRLMLNPQDAGVLLPALWEPYAGALDRLRVDDRSFSTESVPLMTNLSTLVKIATAGGASALPLLTATRGYLVRHLSAARCTESGAARVWTLSAGGTPSPRTTLAERLVEQFNGMLTAAGVSVNEVRPLTADEVRPAKLEGSAKEIMWWGTPSALKMLNDLKHLRFGTAEQQALNNQKERRADGRAQFLTSDQRSEAAWEAEVRDYLKGLEQWKTNHEEGETEFFHMSVVNYGGLTELIPSRTLRATILRSFVAFLGQSEMRKKSPPEWFTHANRLVQYPPGETDAEKTWIREELRASGDPALALYLDLWAITPR